MGYNEFILSANVTSVVILLMMGLLLCFAARFKGESSYAVLITVLTTIPKYLYNICRCIEWNDMAIFLAPLCYSANLALMPLLYLLVHRAFNPFYRFTFTGLLHFIPAFLFFAIISIYLFLLPANEYPHFIAIENIGRGSWVSNVNYLILLIQLGCYLFVIFRVSAHNNAHFFSRLRMWPIILHTETQIKQLLCFTNGSKTPSQKIGHRRAKTTA